MSKALFTKLIRKFGTNFVNTTLLLTHYSLPLSQRKVDRLCQGPRRQDLP
jgi:hypothetical protein